MSELLIQHERSESKGRYFIKHDVGESELSYSVMSEKLVIADHTSVAAGLEGQGVGLVLLKAIIAAARAEGFRIVPLCPFVNAQRRKPPEWADVFSV